MKKTQAKEKPNFGPFEVVELNVRQGLEIMELAHDNNPNFKTELLLACVRRNGEPIEATSFKEFMPFLSDIIFEAMQINGFTAEETKQDG